MVGYILVYFVVVVFFGLLLVLVSVCGCIGVKELEYFSGFLNLLICSFKVFGSLSDRWK